MKRSILSLVLVALGVSCIAVCNIGIERHAVNPVPLNQLGLPPEAVEPFREFVASLPPLQVVGAESDADNRNKRVVLDSHLLRVGGGIWPWHGPQETGDCAAQAIAGGIEIDTGVQTESDPEIVWRPVNRGAIYGGGRVEIGRRAIKGAGLVPSWGLQYVDNRGILWQDEPGVPAYSGTEMDDWGRNGVPAKFLDLMKPYAGLTFAACRSAQDVCNANVAGNPVIFGSMKWGTNHIKLIEGRNVAFDTANWPHAQIFSGYDGTLSSGQKLFRAINSWGPNAHSPKSKMPGDHPGGYYITWETVDEICKEGMTFALSGTNGFRQREIVPDFSVIGAAGPVPVLQQEEIAAMFPLPASFQLPGSLLGVAIIAIGLVMLVRWGNVARRVGVAALLAAVSLPVMAEAQTPDFAALTRAAQSTKVVTASEAVPDFQALTKAACECPCGVNGCRCLGDCQTNKPAVKPSAAAMQKLLQSVELGNEAGQMGRPMAATEKPRPTEVATVPPQNYGGYTRFIWTDGTTRSTPQPGAYYPAAGGLLIPVNSTPVSTSPRTGHWETRRVCHGGTCSLQTVWVP